MRGLCLNNWTVTQSRGARRAWDCICRCHRFDKKTKKFDGLNRTPYEIRSRKFVCVNHRNRCKTSTRLVTGGHGSVHQSVANGATDVWRGYAV